jgi:hypothetical protein
MVVDQRGIPSKKHNSAVTPVNLMSEWKTHRKLYSYILIRYRICQGLLYEEFDLLETKDHTVHAEGGKPVSMLEAL